MKNKIFVFVISLVSLFALGYSLFAGEANAHCPLCTAGAGFGLSLSRILGVDDSITGVWLAAFLGAISFWSANSIKKRKQIPFIEYRIIEPALYVLIFAASLWSFYKFNLIDIHAGQIFGLDKLTFGMILGGIVFYLVDKIDNLIIKKAGKVLFPYQRLIVSLGTILVLSLAVYILINYYV